MILIELKNGMFIFCETASEPSECPVCTGQLVEYGKAEFEDDLVYHPWHCRRCGSSGKEVGRITFAGHNIHRCDVDSQIDDVLAAQIDDRQKKTKTL